ncbi:MAG: hypothetical protein SF029_19705 [bacterium]|nr:hypothetical protein [bacterium]
MELQQSIAVLTSIKEMLYRAKNAYAIYGYEDYFSMMQSLQKMYDKALVEHLRLVQGSTKTTPAKAKRATHLVTTNADFEATLLKIFGRNGQANVI